MIITAEYQIARCGSSMFPLTPIEIKLKNPYEDCFMNLDREACDRHNLRLSFALSGKILACRFESIENPNDSDIATGSYAKDNLVRCTMKRIGKDFPGPGYAHWTVKLATADLTKLRSKNPTVCPFYQFLLDLSEEEYKKCLALPLTAVFRLSFKVQNAFS